MEICRLLGAVYVYAVWTACDNQMVSILIIRRRYSKTRMAAHRRDHLAHNVRFLTYTAFRVRQQYGRRPVVYRWHFKKEALTVAALQEAISKLNGLGVVDRPSHLFFTY